jgi:hypothetical protein
MKNAGGLVSGNGLVVDATAGSTIKGLAIEFFQNAGILVESNQKSEHRRA